MGKLSPVAFISHFLADQNLSIPLMWITLPKLRSFLKLFQLYIINVGDEVTLLNVLGGWIWYIYINHDKNSTQSLFSIIKLDDRNMWH